MTGLDDTLASEISDALTSSSRVLFLLSLSAEVSLAARDSYTEAGLTVGESQHRLRCLNEVQIVVGAQLATAVLKTPPAYPDHAFVEVLTQKARVGGCRSSLEMALRRAADKVVPAHK